MSLQGGAFSHHGGAHRHAACAGAGCASTSRAGNATVNVVFPSDAITVEGEPRDYRSVADSGNVMHRRFCPSCGTHLFSAAESRPHLIIVRNGALDDTALARPGATIWTDAAPEWAWIDETLPQHAGQPPPVA